MTSHPQEISKNHSNNFDAIRITAALAVLYSHHFALTAQPEPSFLNLHSWGGLAVLVFFIISGYLVTASWYNDPNFIRFSFRRILRIWPALTIVVFLTAYVLGAAVTQFPVTSYWEHRATFDYLLALIMQIHFVLPGVFEHNPYPLSVNGSLWTIPFEVRCYVALATAGLMGLMRSRIIWMAIIAICMAWFLITSSPDMTGRVNYGRELSAFFLMGSTLFIFKLYWERHPLLWLLTAGAGAALLWWMGRHYTALLIFLPIIIIYIGTRSTFFISHFGRCGDPSYGIYLISYPVQQTIIHFFWPRFGFSLTLILSSAITIALAYASWHGVEKIALRLKPSKNSKPKIPPGQKTA